MGVIALVNPGFSAGWHVLGDPFDTSHDETAEAAYSTDPPVLARRKKDRGDQ